MLSAVGCHCQFSCIWGRRSIWNTAFWISFEMNAAMDILSYDMSQRSCEKALRTTARKSLRPRRSTWRLHPALTSTPLQCFHYRDPHRHCSLHPDRLWRHNLAGQKVTCRGILTGSSGGASGVQRKCCGAMREDKPCSQRRSCKRTSCWHWVRVRASHAKTSRRQRSAGPKPTAKLIRPVTAPPTHRVYVSNCVTHDLGPWAILPASGLCSLQSLHDCMVSGPQAEALAPGTGATFSTRGSSGARLREAACAAKLWLLGAGPHRSARLLHGKSNTGGPRARGPRQIRARAHRVVQEPSSPSRDARAPIIDAALVRILKPLICKVMGSRFLLPALPCTAGCALKVLSCLIGRRSLGEARGVPRKPRFAGDFTPGDTIRPQPLTSFVYRCEAGESAQYGLLNSQDGSPGKVSRSAA